MAMGVVTRIEDLRTVRCSDVVIAVAAAAADDDDDDDDNIFHQ